jgi:hypothetical protein
MRRTRLRYPLLTLLAVVAAFALIFGTLKAAERERGRRSLGGVRVTSALKNYQRRLTLYDGGEVRLNEVYTWSLHVMEAERDLASTSVGRSAAVEAHRARMEAIQKAYEASRTSDGNFCPDYAQIDALDYFVKEAAYWLSTER